MKLNCSCIAIVLWSFNANDVELYECLLNTFSHKIYYSFQFEFHFSYLPMKLII